MRNDTIWLSVCIVVGIYVAIAVLMILSTSCNPIIAH